SLPKRKDYFDTRLEECAQKSNVPLCCQYCPEALVELVLSFSLLLYVTFVTSKKKKSFIANIKWVEREILNLKSKIIIQIVWWLNFLKHSLQCSQNVKLVSMPKQLVGTIIFYWLHENLLLAHSFTFQ